MIGVQVIHIIGTAGGDATMKYLPSGAAVAKFSLAVNERWTDKAGEKQERCEWFDCSVFGKSAERAAEYIVKGSNVYVEGKIRTEEWVDKEGAKHSKKGVGVNRFQMLGAPGEKRTPRPEKEGVAKKEEPAFDDFDDLDKPF
jgi:single-strand DNA-binding protein